MYDGISEKLKSTYFSGDDTLGHINLVPEPSTLLLRERVVC